MTLLNGTMTPIQTITVGAGGAASIEFTNIPQTYTDLVILLSGRINTTFGNAWYDTYLKVNSVAGTSRDIYGTGNAVGSGSDTEIRILGIPSSQATSNIFSNASIYITNYASTTQNKSISIDSVSENNAISALAQLGAGLYSANTAITSLTLDPYLTGNFVQHSTATLYGVKSYVGETGGKAIGGTVTSDANYWYHTFTTSGMFTPTQSLSADCLVIAGGGGGGHGGGGGAGGVAYYSSQSLTTQNYAVLVGAGGMRGGWSNPQINANNGSNSSFGSLTSADGGGRGGVYDSTANGGNGGSGGGAASGQTSQTYSGGAGTSGQGNKGGDQPTGSSNQGSGGGGGAGAAGANANGTAGGAGGVGTSSYSSWGSVTSTGQNVSGTYFYAGGGGGSQGPGTSASCGAGGNGGGGGATLNQNGTAGTTNTGGGGGGGSWPANLGGNGGSGIVIIRYAK